MIILDFNNNAKISIHRDGPVTYDPESDYFMNQIYPSIQDNSEKYLKNGPMQMNTNNSLQINSLGVLPTDFNSGNNLLSLMGTLNNKSNFNTQIYSPSNFNKNDNTTKSNQIYTSDMFHNYSSNKNNLISNTQSVVQNENKNSLLKSNIIKQTKLHNSTTFRQVGPQLDSTVNAYGKKYSDELLSKNKRDPKIGYYGKSRLTR